jgi:DNA-binding LacI/PurR family transcriptional regulator
MAELGAAGVARLLRLLDGDDTDVRTQIHAVELVVRESTARPHEYRTTPTEESHA